VVVSAATAVRVERSVAVVTPIVLSAAMRAETPRPGSPLIVVVSAATALSCAEFTLVTPSRPAGQCPLTSSSTSWLGR